jgi:rod shape-determining protein MreC
MNERRRIRTLFVLLVLAALVLVTLDFRGEDGAIDAGRDAATIGLAPFERSLTLLAEPVRRLNTGARDLLRTRAENQRLRAEVAALRERRRSFDDMARELEELRTLLGVRDRYQLVAVTARVIAVSPSNFEWTLTIDVGSDDGVERGMAVVARDGLVGRVLHVTPGASRVLLLIDPNFSVAARTVGGSGLGLIDGRGSEPLRFTPLDARSDVAEGEEIVTATFAGSAIPAGLPLGRVERREDSASRLSSTYTVRPFVDVATVDHLLVILAGPAPEVPLFSDSDDITVGATSPTPPPARPGPAVVAPTAPGTPRRDGPG